MVSVRKRTYDGNEKYDPETGHFTQEDPIGLAGGMNLYGFAGGDPVNFSDPTGLAAEDNGAASNFDCRLVPCPEPKQIIQDKTVRDAATDLEKVTKKDGLEHGAFLFNGPNGTIRVGPRMTGTKTLIPQMAHAPDDAIGSIHSHTDGTSPSGYDLNHARGNHINVEVVSGGKLYWT